MKIRFLPVAVTFLVLAGNACADSVKLRVLAPDGKPVARAPVRVMESSGAWFNIKSLAPRDFQTDEAGILAFETEKPLVTLDAKKLTESNMGQLHQAWVRVTALGLATRAQTVKAGDNEIKLQAGRNWGGTLFDEEEKPVVNAKVAISGFGTAEEKGTWTSFPKELQPEAISDANGKWQIEGLPLAGSARLQVEDARFVREEVTFPLDARGAPPLFVERGATIRGRLLAPDGKGAGQVELVAPTSGYPRDPVRTQTDGTFAFEGLRAGSYYLQTYNNHFNNNKNHLFIIEPRSVAVKTGESRDIGDWKTKSGFLMTGILVEAKTKKPIKDASISLFGPGDGQGTTDAQGKFSFRASDDGHLSVYARGFVSIYKRLSGEPTKGVLNAGTIELKRGLEVKGTIKDEAGRGVQEYLTVDVVRDNVHTQVGTRSEADGSFSLGGMETGNFTLKINGRKIKSNPKFAVANGGNAPLQVVVEGKSVDELKTQTVSGRALDGEGKPVAGAQIGIHGGAARGSYQDLTAASDFDGRFEATFSVLSQPGATLKITRVFRPGYTLARGATPVKLGEKWQIDAVLQPRGAALKGRVVDAEGAPKANVWVSILENPNSPIVQSGADGTFSIEGAPSEGATLVASSGGDWGELALDGKTPQVQLQSSPALDAKAFVDEILPRAKLGYSWESHWNTLGSARIETMIRNSRDGNWTWNGFLREFSRREPAQFLKRGDELVALSSEDGRAEAEAILARARALSSTEEERTKARAWLDAQILIKRGMQSASIEPLLQMAIVAEALKAGDGAQWIDFAATIASQLRAEDRSNRSYELGQLVAALGPDALNALIEDWNPKAQLSLMSQVLGVWARAGDLAAARATLTRMEALLPAAQADQNSVQTEGFEQKPSGVISYARGEYALALANTEPKLALELVPNIPDHSQTEVRLKAGKNAARLGQNELAAQALRDVFEMRYSNVEPGAEAAQIALSFDAKLANELFAKAWDKAKPQGDENWRHRASVAAYASARAAKWPGESRILIEREWRERIAAFQPKTDNDIDSAEESLKALAIAMAAFNPRRALEMAEKLPEKGDVRAEAYSKIAVIVLERK